jgi:acyl CoA:acetate/3-ketoacid CoA transferase alpha subunit
MASAAKLVIVEVEEPILPAGAIDADDVHVPGILVHRLVVIPPAPEGIWPALPTRKEAAP